MIDNRKLICLNIALAAWKGCQNQRVRPRLPVIWINVERMSEVSDDAFKLFSHMLIIDPKIRRVQVRVNYKDQQYPCQIFMALKVSEVVGDIINIISETIQVSPELLTDPSCLIMAKIDVNQFGTLNWMEAEKPVYDYGIEHGDEFVLKHVDEIDQVDVIVPPSPDVIKVQYKSDLTVKDAQNILQSIAQTDTTNYSFYLPRFGIWLEESRPLCSYNFESSVIEYRTKASQMVIRVVLTENDQTIAMKVLPSQSGADVCNMINYQLIKRSLKKKNPQAIYGLCVPNTSEWIHDNARIELYAARFRDAFHFKVHYRPFKIHLWNQEQMNLHIDSYGTVSSTVETLVMMFSQTRGTTYELYLPTGERANDNDKIWELMDNQFLDYLYYGPKPCPILVSDEEESTIITVEIDFSKKLHDLLPFLCRKLGIREHLAHRVSVHGRESLNCYELYLQAGDHLIIHQSKQNLPAPVKIDHGSLRNIWDETVETLSNTTPITFGNLNHLILRLTSDQNQGETSSRRNFH